MGVFTNKKNNLTSLSIFQKKIGYVEQLFSHPKDSFSIIGNIEQNLINIASVHPLRKQDIMELLSKSKSTWHTVESLLKKGYLIEKKYKGEYFYLTKHTEQGNS